MSTADIKLAQAQLCQTICQRLGEVSGYRAFTPSADRRHAELLFPRSLVFPNQSPEDLFSQVAKEIEKTKLIGFMKIGRRERGGHMIAAAYSATLHIKAVPFIVGYIEQLTEDNGSKAKPLKQAFSDALLAALPSAFLEGPLDRTEADPVMQNIAPHVHELFIEDMKYRRTMSEMLDWLCTEVYRGSTEQRKLLATTYLTEIQERAPCLAEAIEEKIRPIRVSNQIFQARQAERLSQNGSMSEPII